MAKFSQSFTTIIIYATFWLPLWQCQGSPTYAAQYHSSDFAPEWTDLGLGPQIVAPDTPYIAAAGKKQLYFLDTRLDPDSAQHIKNQIEAVGVPKPTERFEIDEIECTAKVVDSSTGETTFTFDPPYARVFFARQINKYNPNIKLPEHPPAGDWVVTYNDDPKSYSPRNHSPGNLFERIYQYCDDYPCERNEDCPSGSYIGYDYCSRLRVDNQCSDESVINGIGSCSRRGCNIAVDTAREKGETDSAYYQRMDEQHWG